MGFSPKNICHAALIAGFAVAAAWIIRSTVGFGFFHPDRIQALGWPAPVLFGILIAVLGGVGIPPVFLILPAAAAWPFCVAFPTCLLGGLGAALSGFWLSRHFFKQTRLPRLPKRIVEYEHRLESHAFSTILILRLFFYLLPPINWMLGLSRVSLRLYLAATITGMLPWTLAYLLTGQGITALLFKADPPMRLSIVGVISLLALIWHLRRKRRQKS